MLWSNASLGLTIPLPQGQDVQHGPLKATGQAILLLDKETMPGIFLLFILFLLLSLLNLMFLKPSAPAGAFLHKPVKIHLFNV